MTAHLTGQNLPKPNAKIYRTYATYTSYRFKALASKLLKFKASYRFAILPHMPRKKKQGTITVGLVQMSCEQKPQANLKKAIAGISTAAKRGAQIVCLQELFRSQYFCQTENIELFK